MFEAILKFICAHAFKDRGIHQYNFDTHCSRLDESELSNVFEASTYKARTFVSFVIWKRFSAAFASHEINVVLKRYQNLHGFIELPKS